MIVLRSRCTAAAEVEVGHKTAGLAAEALGQEWPMDQQGLQLLGGWHMDP